MAEVSEALARRGYEKVRWQVTFLEGGTTKVKIVEWVLFAIALVLPVRRLGVLTGGGAEGWVFAMRAVVFSLLAMGRM